MRNNIFMLKDIISNLACKKYGTILGLLKVNWNIIDEGKKTYPKSYNSRTKILIVKCADSEAILSSRYLVDSIKEKILANFSLEVKVVKFVK